MIALVIVCENLDKIMNKYPNDYFGCGRNNGEVACNLTPLLWNDYFISDGYAPNLTKNGSDKP